MEGMSQKEKAFIDSIRSEHYFKVFEIMYGTGFAPLVMAALHEFLNDNDFTGVLDVYADPIDPHETWLKEMERIKKKLYHHGRFGNIDVLYPSEPEHLVHYSFAVWHGEVLDYLVENKGMDIKNMRSIRNRHNPFLLFNNAVVKRTYSHYRKLAKDNKRAANFIIAFNTEFDEVKIAKDREIQTFLDGAFCLQWWMIQKISRVVELDDDLVKAYTKFKDVRDNLFVIALVLRYGEVPDISDDELSAFCNKTLVEDIEAMRVNALVVDYIQKNKEKLIAMGWVSRSC